VSTRGSVAQPSKAACGVRIRPRFRGLKNLSLVGYPSWTRSLRRDARNLSGRAPLQARVMCLGFLGVVLVIALTAPLVHAQGYNNGGYGGKTGPSGGGGGGSVTGGSCGPNQFATAVGPTGVPSCIQPAASQVSGLAPSATTDTTNASNIASGTLNASRLPTITSASVNSSIAKTANNLSDLASAGTAATNLGLQYYADNCGLPNNGSSDDAAGLRTCMAAMPAGATMNLDGSKPYYFASHSSSDAIFGSQPCEIYAKTGITLKLNGATITQSPAESAVSGIFMICVGSLNFNNPGASGGSPTFDAIADTPANATSVTLSTPANAANYHAGDDLYIDCGSNTGDADIFVGWDEVNDVNSSTGIINLKYPMLKPYNHTATGCPGSPSAARIYDWTTSGGGSSGANLGPLAHDIYIEGPGTLLTGSSDSDAPIVIQGVVRWGIDYITVINPGNGQFAFANNNHLGHMDHDVLTGWGCSGDTAFNAGEFTSSYNSIDWDKATSTGDPGVGCGSSTHEAVFGDAEGTEAEQYDHDTAQVLVGLSSNPPNLGACLFTGGSWGETVDHMECYAQSPMNGIEDTIGVATSLLATQGPIKVTNSHITSSSNALNLQVPDDVAIGNTLDCPNSGGCLNFPYWSGRAIGNTINMSACGSNTYGITIGTATSSSIIGNTIHDLSGTCSAGINISGSSSSSNLTLAGNSIDSTFGTPTNFKSGNFPSAAVSGNSNTPDYNGLGTQSPSIVQMLGSPFGTIGACQPMVLAGSGAVNTPGSAGATGVIGFNPSPLPQNTSGQTGVVVTHGTSCGICDGTCTNGDLFEMSPTSATQIHDIGTSCSGAALGAQVGGVLNGSGTSGSSVAISVEPGLCPQSKSLPAANVTGLAPSATTDTTNASNIASGTLPGQRLTPAVSAPLNSYYATNGQPLPTFGGAEFNGSAQVTELTAPTGVACTCAGGSGTTYSYAVSAVEYPLNGTAGGYQAVGYVIQEPAGESAKSSTVTCSGPSSLSYPANYCTVTWNAWSDVVGYKVWGRTGVTTSLTGVSANTGTGGMLGNSFVDYGVVAPQTSSQYQTGLFKAEGGLGTGDWSANGWPGQPGDVYFKELGSSAENVVMGSTNDQLQVNGSTHVMKVIATGGFELNSDTVPLASQIMLRGGLNGDTGPLTSISGTVVLNGTINADAIKLEHLTAHASSLTCTTNPTFTVYDCGTTAACSSPVTLASVTPTSTGLTSGDAGITTSTIAAGHYVEIALTAGTCTTLNGGASVEWAGN
jgi:hypothetical protein